MRRILIPSLILAFIISACNAPGEMEVHQAWVRPTAQGENAAVYLTLHNHSDVEDELTGASTTITGTVEIHESKMENDVMQMNMIPSLPIAADEEIIFTPGGIHIMLTDIKEELVLGEHMGLVLHFKSHEDIVVEVHVENSMSDEDHGPE